MISLSVVIVIYAVIFYHARQSVRQIAPSAPTTITNRSTRNILLSNFKREMTIIRNMLILIGIFACVGVPYIVLVLWHITQLPSTEALYLFTINCILLSTSLMMVALLLMNKELRQCAITYLHKLC